MRYWQEAKEDLKRLFDYDRVGLVTDMDGTVSYIQPVPSTAKPTPRSAEALQKLHERLSLVAVVSGRSAADLSERINIPQLTYAGNHGLERWQNGQSVIAPQVEPYRPHIINARDAIAERVVEGMWIEDKIATMSIHYRHTANPAEVEKTFRPFMESLAKRENLQLFDGRMIFEFRPPIDLNKGSIFREFVTESRLSSALFLGDDVTDTDAFRVARQLREAGQCYALAIGVESEATPAVVYETSDILCTGIPDVEDLLEWLLSVSHQ